MEGIMDLKTINEMILSFKKIINENDKIYLPNAGNSHKLELKSNLFYFWIDVNRKGRIKRRCTLQLREKQHKDKALLRLDLIGPPHPNPPGSYELAGKIIPCPHIHIAHPEYGESIAYPLDHNYAKMYISEEELEDMVTLLIKFLERCNVANINDYTYEEQGELL